MLLKTLVLLFVFYCNALAQQSGCGTKATPLHKQEFTHETGRDPLEEVTVENQRDTSCLRHDPMSIQSHLERSSIIFGLANVANESKISFDCYHQMQHVRKSILRREPWALKVLDSSGTKTSGFVLGHNYWMGNSDSCKAVMKPIDIKLAPQTPRIMDFAIIDDKAPFDMSYRVVYVRHHSPWQVEIHLMSEKLIHIGLCMPSICSGDEIEEMTADYVASDLFVEKAIYDLQPEVVYSKDLQLKWDFFDRPSFYILAFSIIFTLLMMAAASFLRVKTIIVAELIDGKSPLLSEPSEMSMSVSTNGTGKEIQSPPQEEDEDGDDWLGRIKDGIKCFDVQSNFEKLFKTSNLTSNQIPVINGMRSLGSFWILAFHVLWYMYFATSNKSAVAYPLNPLCKVVKAAAIYVDVFFTISGFLQVYNFMRNKAKMELIRNNSFQDNFKEITKTIFHRLLRLVPLYLVVMTLVELQTAYSEKVSVFHIHERNDQLCSQYWWRNLLLIQNFFKFELMCANWTWSLACDMQFFLLTTLLLFLYTKKPKLAKGILSAIFWISTLWSCTVGINKQLQFSVDSMYETSSFIYINPVVRLLPYIIGATAAGYFVENNCKVQMSFLLERVFYLMASIIFLLSIYILSSTNIPPPFATYVVVFGRYFLSAAACWVIIGSATGRSIWWTRLLESKICQHINRVTYAVYLLNPVIISIVFSTAAISTHVEPLMLFLTTAGISILVYLASVIFSLAFEMPYGNLSTLIVKSNKVKGA